jgi:hypothetical protein
MPSPGTQARPTSGGALPFPVVMYTIYPVVNKTGIASDLRDERLKYADF